MTCQEFRARADAYVNGDLGLSESAAFEAHLGSCAECETVLLESTEAPAGLPLLPRSIEPAADLWPAIRGRLLAGRNPRWIAIPRWALAAAAVLLVALSSGLTAVLLTPDPPAAVSSGDISALEAQYATVSEDLSGALERARTRLGPETMATIERNLGIIDAALEETRRALARDPGNPALGQMVVATWRQKVDLLRRAAALGSET